MFYSIPCLMGLIRPEYLNILAAFSHACFLLAQDVLEPEDINRAERLLLGVAQDFERTFGVVRLKYNLHMSTKHKVRSVRTLGNPPMYSTCYYESLHRDMIARVASPKGAHMQIVTRLLLRMIVCASQYDERLSEHVRLRIEEILNPYQLKRKRQVGPHMYFVGRGDERRITQEEAGVFQREGIPARRVVDYKSCQIGTTRYKSLRGQNRNIKSDDTFIYTWQDTFCTITSICLFMDDNGEERTGMFVTEHDVHRVLPVARHLSILRNNVEADLLHFIQLNQVRCPAIKMYIGNVVYASCVPNCIEID